MERFAQNELLVRTWRFGRRLAVSVAATQGVVATVALGVVIATLSSNPVVGAQHSTAPLPACVLPKQPKGVCMTKEGKAAWEQAHQCTFCAVTMGELQNALPSAPPGTLKVLFDDVNGHMVEYGLDSPNRLWHFFAQVRAETGAGRRLVENLNYAALILSKKFEYFKAHPADACKFGYIKDGDMATIQKCKSLDPGGKHPEWWVPHGANQEAIANRAYAGKNENGDFASGDGWRYRGRGMLQVTGKGNYKQGQQWYDDKFKPDPPIDFVAHPELLEQPDYAFKASVGFWLGHSIEADADKTESVNVCVASDIVTEKINGAKASDETKKERCDALKAIMNTGVFSEVDCHLPSAPPPSSPTPSAPAPLRPPEPPARGLT